MRGKGVGRGSQKLSYEGLQGAASLVVTLTDSSGRNPGITKGPRRSSNPVPSLLSPSGHDGEMAGSG